MFISGNERLADFVPDYWKDYLLHPGENPEKALGTSGGKHSPPPAKHIRVAGTFIAPKLLYGPAPSYPMEAKLAGVRGTVEFKAVIGKNGRIKSLTLLQPVGMGLDDAAAEAVRTWRYSPTMLNGEPVEIDTEINVNFRLNQ